MSSELVCIAEAFSVTMLEPRSELDLACPQAHAVSVRYGWVYCDQCAWEEHLALWSEILDEAIRSTYTDLYKF